MSERSTAFQKSLDIVHSVLIYVVLSYALVLMYTSDFLRSLGMVSTAAMILLKTYVDSGIYATLTELVSGEEITLSRANFFRNARQHWAAYFSLTVLLFAIRLLGTTVSAGYPGFNFAIFDLSLNVIFLYAVAYIMFYRKYKRPLALPHRKMAVNGSAFVMILGICLADGLLTHLPRISQTYNVYVSGLFILVSTYIRLLAFIYLSNLIHNPYHEIREKFASTKELIIVVPAFGGIWTSVVNHLAPQFYPAVFTVLKAFTPKSYTLRLFDRRIWNKRYYSANKLVAITCYSENSAEAYKIAKEFRKRGSVVIMGGPHVSHFPEEALEFCDSVVVGEAEGLWTQVVNDYENHGLKPRYQRFPTEEDYARVHQELVQSEPYVIKDFLETTRGCKYRCEFCTSIPTRDNKIWKKPIHEVVELVERIKHKYKSIYFMDNNMYSDPQYARELFQALKPLNVKWWTSFSLDIAKSEKILRLAKESGCYSILFGYEIFGGSLEKKQGGKMAMMDKYLEFTKNIKKVGFQFKAHFIYGFDSDSVQSLFEIWKFCFKIHPFFSALRFLTPLPGSPLYKRLLRENRLTNLNWRNYNSWKLLFKHEHLNSWLISNIYFVVAGTFFLTTSKLGYCVLVVICSLITIVL